MGEIEEIHIRRIRVVYLNELIGYEPYEGEVEGLPKPNFTSKYIIYTSSGRKELIYVDNSFFIKE